MLLDQSPTLFWLVLTVGFTSMMWIPYIVELLVHYGPVQALRDPNGILVHGSAWAQRAKRAHYNAVENLVIFAPLVILVHILQLESSLTAGAAMYYFLVRVGHYGVYTIGVPFIRTILYLAGVGCQAVFVLRLLGVL